LVVTMEFWKVRVIELEHRMVISIWTVWRMVVWIWMVIWTVTMIHLVTVTELEEWMMVRKRVIDLVIRLE